MKPHDFQFDLAVIGAGSAGFAAARTASAAGRKTVLIEGGAEVGGLCILRGCMPTKTLLYAAEVLHLLRQASTWGLHAQGVSFDFQKVMARKSALIQEFADYRFRQLTAGKFEFRRGKARFADPHTLALDTGESITAGAMVIATGSIVPPPPLPGLADIGYWTSDDILSLQQLPESILVLGGGPVAVELAQFLCRFGAKVSLVQRSPHILRDFDPDAAAVIERVLRKEGIDLYTGTRLIRAENGSGGKRVTFEHDGHPVTVEAGRVLHGLGRIPAIADLDLDRAGVRVHQGRILTDDRMATTVPHIFAAGDCTGTYEIVHIAIQQGETAVHNWLHPDQPRRMDYRLLCSVVFTDPQVAQAGLTEKAAQAAAIPYRAASYPFNDHGKSLIMEALEGFVKLLADPASGEILGGSVVGPAGGELIHEIVAAMHHRMTARDLALLPHYHPTLAEIWTYPAEELASMPN
ncbi:MAG TPA: NAD(P)/FAD-dependent oxidoreductase [Candidatus Paceibacterota bacterium]|nr:NAD(P)/FAD-dependent oxidoreductase [Verrucomicrobiota bacterium]HOX03117.1 NAD(P)/FAD-dependent oxidoreductase [Verrucomicrobiota bacterium]HRZ44747.1 NAD(P)/FAD-dependent oxidoreductase [Candidatus Paceibacterota bacterium]HRZ94766.1 NAD(P)/FAD-dependent oxidoreductase [Candidatus Paceibacterota bacterium]